jgi:hypothetical protein
MTKAKVLMPITIGEAAGADAYCAVMRNTNLSLELKGMLAIVATFPQKKYASSCQRAELQSLCNVGREKYFRLIREAKDFGFLWTISQRYRWDLNPKQSRAR